MPLGNEFKNDIKAARKIRLPWWGVLCVMIGTLPIIWAFDHFERYDLAMPTLYSIATLGFAIGVKWKLRRCGWFWVIMAIIAALHVLLILTIRWTTAWVPALVIVSIGSIEICAILWILYVVGKFMKGSKTTER